MSNEERLRKALNWLMHLHHGVSKGGEETSPPSDDEWKQCLQEAEDVLNATAGRPEMDRLVEWLQSLMDEAQKHTPPGFEMMFPAVLVSDVLEHIREMQTGPGHSN